MGVLPGIGSFLGAASGFSLTFITDAQASTTSITIPAASAVGDLAVLMDYGGDFGSTVPSSVTPTNWTSIATTSLGGIAGSTRVNMSYRVLTAGNPGSSVSGQSSSPEKVMLIFRPSTPIVAVTPVLYTSTTSAAGTPASITVNPSAETVPVIVFGVSATGGGGTTPALAYVASFDTTYPRGESRFGYKLANSSPPASGAVSGGDGGFSNVLMANYLRISNV